MNFTFFGIFFIAFEVLGGQIYIHKLKELISDDYKSLHCDDPQCVVERLVKQQMDYSRHISELFDLESKENVTQEDVDQLIPKLQNDARQILNCDTVFFRIYLNKVWEEYIQLNAEMKAIDGAEAEFIKEYTKINFDEWKIFEGFINCVQNQTRSQIRTAITTTSQDENQLTLDKKSLVLFMEKLLLYYQSISKIYEYFNKKGSLSTADYESLQCLRKLLSQVFLFLQQTLELKSDDEYAPFDENFSNLQAIILNNLVPLIPSTPAPDSGEYDLSSELMPSLCDTIIHYTIKNMLIQKTLQKYRDTSDNVPPTRERSTGLVRPTDSRHSIGPTRGDPSRDASTSRPTQRQTGDRLRTFFTPSRSAPSGDGRLNLKMDERNITALLSELDTRSSERRASARYDQAEKRVPQYFQSSNPLIETTPAEEPRVTRQRIRPRRSDSSATDKYDEELHSDFWNFTDLLVNLLNGATEDFISLARSPTSFSTLAKVNIPEDLDQNIKRDIQGLIDMLYPNGTRRRSSDDPEKPATLDAAVIGIINTAQRSINLLQNNIVLWAAGNMADRLQNSINQLYGADTAIQGTHARYYLEELDLFYDRMAEAFTNFSKAFQQLLDISDKNKSPQQSSSRTATPSSSRPSTSKFGRRVRFVDPDSADTSGSTGGIRRTADDHNSSPTASIGRRPAFFDPKSPCIPSQSPFKKPGSFDRPVRDGSGTSTLNSLIPDTAPSLSPQDMPTTSTPRANTHFGKRLFSTAPPSSGINSTFGSAGATSASGSVSRKPDGSGILKLHD